MRKLGLITLILAGGFSLQAQTPAPPAAPAPPPDSRSRERLRRLPGNAPEDALYDQGSRMLQKRDYEGAEQTFGELMKRGGSRAEGAAYWQAYALNKLGRKAEALAALAEFEKRSANSRWLNDAKALELEVRQSQGQSVSPESQNDDELKLMALASLMSTEPSRAVPVLRKVLAGTSSLMVKEQALFVLAQSQSAEARSALVDLVKGKGNPDLQLKAVEMVGMRGGPETAALLAEVYSTGDNVLKKRALQGLMMARATDKLLMIARTETDPTLRVEAIRMVGMGRDGTFPVDTIRQMYATEKERKAKMALLDALAMRKQGKALEEIVRAESDVQMKREALHRLQMADPKAAQDVIISILEK